MSEIYDNWERLVAAVIKKQQLWELFHQQSRSPSTVSDASTQSPPQLVLLSDFRPPFAVVRASTALLGRGSACVAEMDGGRRFVVKSADIGEADFMRNMEIVGSFSHENVVPLRAYYSSPPHKLVVYDYYSNGSVYSLLYGHNRANVEWETRVRIAIGAARGIAEIHSQLGGILVHGNIKASNILLNQQLYGCVSEYGFTNTQNASHDVYSFGILLLELLVRNSAAHSPVDLIEIVNSIKNNARAAKVFDADLLRHSTIRQQMIKMLQIGIRCVAKSSKKRPKMFEVVKMLEGLVMCPRLTGRIRTGREHVFVGDGDHMLGVEDIMTAPSEVLGSGSCGTCFKKTLENGHIVVVKMLRHVTATFEEFQLHVEVFGRMNHKNVGRLKAYCYSRDVKLLVYDYYHQGSLSTLLHDFPKASIEWRTILGIAVGVARGIAYIHGRGLVLGNIKATNIFINGQDHSIIAFDAGLGELISPLELPSMLLSSGCCAPELQNSGELSQASDVYSFGVVLLELISGRPSQQLMANCIDNSERTAAQVVDMEEEMMQLLQIAEGCLCSVSEQRPTMLEVVKVLEEISRGIQLGSFVESRLECFLEDLLPLLSS